MKNNMKKFLLLFCMLACMCMVTACGNANTSKIINKTLPYDTPSLKSQVSDMLQGLSSYSDDQIYEIINYANMSDGYTDLHLNWVNSRKEIGAFINITEFEVESDKETITMTMMAQYEKRMVNIEIIIDSQGDIVSSTFNSVYTFAEKAEKSVLNTIIGMGTVFAVLIFISFIISCLKYVNVFENKGNKNKSEGVAQQAVENAIAQIVQKENKLDDLELVAAITAAIAAYEGTSADGFVVRSIKKVNRKR